MTALTLSATRILSPSLARYIEIEFITAHSHVFHALLGAQQVLQVRAREKYCGFDVAQLSS